LPTASKTTSDLDLAATPVVGLEVGTEQVAALARRATASERNGCGS
jgi:hypothetical protein